jgi:cell shape-determining protein MreC
MTEKRFTTQGQSIKHNDELLTLDMVCEMLNDYADENEQLKKELAEYRHEDDCITEYMQLIGEEMLKKEDMND